MLTTVPGVIAALVAALRAAPGLDGVAILDGPPVRHLDRDDVILVGFRGTPGEPGVRATRDPADLGGRTDRESYTLWSIISVASGDTDLAPLRERAVALLNEFAAVVRGDPTLGGAAARLRMTDTDMEQAQTQQGAEVNVAVGLAVDAWVSR